MKIIAAAIALSLAGLAAAPANAESSYWEQRWRARDATPEYGQTERRRADRSVRRYKRGSARGEERRAVRRRYVERDARVSDVIPNPFRVERHDGRAYPTQNNDYWLQSSIYDFNAGKAADLKQYRY